MKRIVNWIEKRQKFLISLVCALAFFSYVFLLRNELKVADNSGNIKIVAAKQKDPLAAGYRGNTRQIALEGQPLSDEEIVRNDWGVYSAAVPIPINITEATDDLENPTMEIQHDGPVRNISFEYSRYYLGGYLQIYLDDVLYMQINTYQEEESYELLTIDFPQHYGLSAANAGWWLQIIVLAAVLPVFVRLELYKRLRIQQFLLAFGLLAAACYALSAGLAYTLPQSFVFSNTLYSFDKAMLVLSLFTFLSLILGQVLLYFVKKRWRFLGQILYLLLIALAPLLIFYLLESPSAYDSNLNAADIPANLAIITIVWLTLAMITTSLRLASMLAAVAALIMGIVNKVLIALRSTPLLAYHFLQIRDGLNVAQNTAIIVELIIPRLIFLSALYCIALAFLPSSRKLFARPKPFSVWQKLPSRLAFLRQTVYQKIITAFIGVLAAFFVARPLVYHIADSVEMRLLFFAMQKTYYEHGFALSFVRFYEVSHVTEPEGYSTDAVKDILSQYPRKTETAKQKPNIIIIQNESLTDYAQLTSLEFEPDPLAFIHSMDDNTIKGVLYASVLGGGTANTEYEVLTSNSLAILPPNAFPYQQLITSPKNNITSALNSYGYQSVALHPYLENFYRRNLVYSYFDFAESYFNNSTPSIEDLVEVQNLRNYVSDASLYQASQKLIEEKQDPLFNFIVTMQGHESYGLPEEESPRTVSIVNGDDDSSATDFLSSVKASDEAFSDFITYLKTSDEPTVVIMYGDHQPGLSNSYFEPALDANDPSAKYQTPFVMWANFDLPQKEEIQLSPNYIVPYLFDILSQTDYPLPVSSYYQFLSELQQQIPIMTTWGYYDDGYTYSEEAPADSQLLSQYRLLEYNNVMDKSALTLTQYYE
ncbi:LTA synthase family protein [Streptococcus pantholopis]|uniref:Sulfatase N-terminal domain-containing protein n=1 Tax=Streptococcus pantholopis TaxID=1811193 RepID=A0A172Q911_9STRE|nr:LTA synthase family protein [Streptococcus pantholopis]AND79954.1 hypothetical protein A0O21_08040 [Streptococcus pantholopis]